MTARDGRGGEGVRRTLGGEMPLGETGGGAGPARLDPRREPLRPALPKRFYSVAEVEPPGTSSAAGVRVLLDGRPVRTPGKRVLALPSRPLAKAVAAEWAAQDTVVDPQSMPLTRMSNTALDGVAGQEDAVRDDIAGFAMSDLVCYRTEAPDELVRGQSVRWDPIVRWAETRLASPLLLAAGLMPVAQSEQVRAGMLGALAPLDAFRLTALHVITTLTGSALLALAVYEGRIDADAAWAAAHVDEDYQESQWGADAEATARRTRRRVEFDAAARLLALAGAG